MNGKRLNTIYTSAQPYSVEAAKILKVDSGIEPVYWLCSEVMKVEIEKNFPHAITHDQLSSFKGLPAPMFKGDIKSEHSLVDRLSSYENIALSMMDRNDSNSGTFSYTERLRFYYDLIGYWSSVIRTLSVDLIVFEEEPHQSSDYILFLVAREQGLQTYMPVRTIADFGLIPMSDFEAGSELLHTLVERHQNDIVPNTLPDYAARYLEKLRGTYESVLAEHLWDQVDRVKSIRKPTRFTFLADAQFFSAKIFVFSSLVQRLRFLLGFDTFPSDQKQKGQKLQDSRVSYPEMVFNRLKTYFKKKSNRAYYQKLTKNELDLDQPYVFCGLQYQPEKSTCPLAGRFVDQTLMCEMLADSVPEGWKVFVKEHPSQFVPDYTRYGERFRDSNFYDRLKRNPKIELVPLSADTFELVDAARAVASATGTLCWESVVREKPALCFGHAWFDSCEGVFKVNSSRELEDGLKLIEGGYKVDYRLVERFVVCLLEVSRRAAVGGPAQLEHLGITVKENASVHAALLMDILRAEHG
tara:strand:- start:25221 stop:26795 length:1575 start_codon:yes stop_codon:yes gene_type:complete